mmetsp:Transcript_72420/g.132586  ORF Transcript_72420/g.132586 Transcript_72420/m.132586 type:complete len:515 (-) Transcript_72420:150-1694(-)
MRRVAMLHLLGILALLGLGVTAVLDMTTPADEHHMTSCHVASSPADGRSRCQDMALLQKSAVREHTAVLPSHGSSAGEGKGKFQGEVDGKGKGSTNLALKGEGKSKGSTKAKESLATATDLIDEAAETSQMPEVLDLLKKKLRDAKKGHEKASARNMRDLAIFSNLAKKKLDVSSNAPPTTNVAKTATAAKSTSKHQELRKSKETSSGISKASKPKEHSPNDEEMSSHIDEEEPLAKASTDKSKSSNRHQPKISASPAKHATSPSTSPRADVDTEKVATSKTPKEHLVETEKEKTLGSAIQRKDTTKAAVSKAEEEQIVSPSVASTVDGSKVALNEKGYRQVVTLQDKDQMKKFLRRVVRSTGLFIAHEHGLDSTATSFSKGKGGHKYADLTEKIAAAAAEPDSWVTITSPHSKVSTRPGPIDEPDLGPGLTAPLNQDGYLQVAELKSSSQMAVFIQRIINRLGFTVKNKYGLQGIVPWFNGENATQSYRALQREIQNTAMTPGQWVTADEPSL